MADENEETAEELETPVDPEPIDGEATETPEGETATEGGEGEQPAEDDPLAAIEALSKINPKAAEAALAALEQEAGIAEPPPVETPDVDDVKPEVQQAVVFDQWQNGYTAKASEASATCNKLADEYARLVQQRDEVADETAQRIIEREIQRVRADHSKALDEYKASANCLKILEYVEGVTKHEPRLATVKAAYADAISSGAIDVSRMSIKEQIGVLQSMGAYKGGKPGKEADKAKFVESLKAMRSKLGGAAKSAATARGSSIPAKPTPRLGTAERKGGDPFASLKLSAHQREILEGI